jgi:hypothetical protein
MGVNQSNGHDIVTWVPIKDWMWSQYFSLIGGTKIPQS